MYIGDFRLGDTFDTKFTTRRFSTGAPFTLAGSPAVAAYPGNSTTEITAGITLTVDFDSRTGLHNVRVVATAANGYAIRTNYALVITTGTVDSVSVVGEVVGSFSIQNRFAPGLVHTGTAAAGGASTITLDSLASSTDSYYQNLLIQTVGGTGSGQVRIITGYVGSTKVATVDSAWLTIPDSTTIFDIYPAVGSASETATAVWAATTRTLTNSGNIKKAASFSKFMFLMTDSTNHNPATGKTVSVTIAKDGGAFAALNSGDTVTEVGNGIYEVDLNATDTNANVFVVRATATGCDDTLERVITTL